MRGERQLCSASGALNVAAARITAAACRSAALASGYLTAAAVQAADHLVASPTKRACHGYQRWQLSRRFYLPAKYDASPSLRRSL